MRIVKFDTILEYIVNYNVELKHKGLGDDLWYLLETQHGIQYKVRHPVSTFDVIDEQKFTLFLLRYGS